MDANEVLVERRILMGRDGVEGRREIALQIGHPQWSQGGDDAVCAIAIRGLDEDMPPVRGRDFYDVLVKAACTLRQRCKEPPHGVRFFYLGEPPYDNERYDGEPVDLGIYWKKSGVCALFSATTGRCSSSARS